MIRRNEISKLAFMHGVPEKTIEKDYVITRMLRHIGPEMVGLGMRFKGGTCLKKAYFRDYRFSEDLDFTIEDTSPVHAIELALSGTARNLTAAGLRVDLGEQRNGENGMTFIARVTGPLGRPGRLKIDITTRELLLFPAAALTLFDEFSDCIGATPLTCYSVEEVFVEKLVCMLDPARIQPRDLFDLDWLLGSGRVDSDAAMWAFPEKAKFKNLDPAGLRGAIERKRPQLKARWLAQLAQQLPDGSLPGFDDAERRLIRLLRDGGLA